MLPASFVFWLDTAQQANRTVFFHFRRGDDLVTFGIERDELLKFQGRGASRITHALGEQRALRVRQYGVHKTRGSVQIGPDKQIELTPGDASSVRFGASFVVP
ncbi:hypothetical protein A1D31_33510 [Bradyrhizobium liaoningense]|nr:hypothetical protein A1D31_33510 [Bradyrhizobium liaoningense]